MSNDYKPGEDRRGITGALRWAWKGSRRWWLVPLALGTVVTIAVWPWDGAIHEAARGLEKSLPSDVRRELNAWQQYGQGFALAVVALLIWTLDRARRRRLLDLLAGVLIGQLVAQGGKLLVGRPRPRGVFADAGTILGPLGEYPVPDGAGGWRLTHAWEAARAGGGGVDLWSMPSSHTLMAWVLSAFLGAVYPRARWVVFGLAALVGVARVLTGAHWASDVVVGGAVGYTIGSVATRGVWGNRALDWVWRRFVDRSSVAMAARLEGPGVGW